MSGLETSASNIKYSHDAKVCSLHFDDEYEDNSPNYDVDGTMLLITVVLSRKIHNVPLLICLVENV